MARTFSEKLNILPRAQRRLWLKLRQIPRHFVLYGGTALALRLGHRSSEDFDFFSSEIIEPASLLAGIDLLSNAVPIQQAPNTLTVSLLDFEGGKISFFGGLTLARVGEPEFDSNETVLIASLEDLAAVKLAVVYQRAEAKDYLDIAAVLKSGIQLEQALGFAQVVYGTRFNLVAALKALSYFEDGNLPTLPGEVKTLLSRAAADATRIAPAKARDRLITPRQYRSA
jgi:hypothetical protein